MKNQKKTVSVSKELKNEKNKQIRKPGGKSTDQNLLFRTVFLNVLCLGYVFYIIVINYIIH